MVIVVVATAPAGVEVGLVGEGPDGLEELELDPEPLQAAIAKAAAAANAAAPVVRANLFIRMSSLDLKYSRA
jgi:hypothetical protein